MKTTEARSDATPPLVVGTFVRAAILERLREAVEIARGDMTGEYDRLRALVAGAAERIDAIGLARVTDATPPPAPPAYCLRFAAFAAARGEPAREFLLIPFGEVVVERPIAGESFVFTRGHAESAKRWFDQMGRKLAVDYEHQSFDRCNTRPDGLRPAAGWIGGLDVRDDGLWAIDVTWTERAGELLRSGEYRYFSPVIFWTDEDHSDVAALGPVALTNDPAMRGVQPLAANRCLAEPPATAPEDDESADSVDALRARVEAAEGEVGMLRQRLAAQAADAFVERGLRLGKILDSTCLDWRADFLRDPDGAAERLARAPVVLPPGRVIALNPHGGVKPLSAARPSTAAATTPSGVEAEDFAAYEQALAAGRVRGMER